MKRIFALATCLFLGLISHAQSYDLILKQESTNYYTAANKDFSIFVFSAPQAINANIEHQIAKELMEKDNVKSVVFNSTKDRVTITLRREFTLKDINAVLNPISVLLINEKETPKAILEKINPATN